MRFDNVAVHGHTVALGHRHFNHIGSHFLAEYAEHRCNQLALAVRREYLLAVANERERNLRMGERRMLYYAENVTRLGEVLLRNFMRAGVLKNRSRTTIVVPSGQPASSCV